MNQNVLAGIFVPAAIFVLAANFVLAGIFVPAANFVLAAIFCASRNICVLFVLLLHVPKSTTLAMARRSSHLITSFLGSLKKRLTSTLSWERECLTRDRVAAGLSLTGGVALCPKARRIYPSLVLVQPLKTRPYFTE